MDYAEVIAKALKGRSVNSVAKAWNVAQPTLDRYVKGKHLPDYITARRIAFEAGISDGDMLKILSVEEAKRNATRYNADRADVAQSVEQLIRNQ
jgi:hypothetical protein